VGKQTDEKKSQSGVDKQGQTATLHSDELIWVTSCILGGLLIPTVLVPEA
jgi:hypothetical protein